MILRCIVEYSFNHRSRQSTTVDHAALIRSINVLAFEAPQTLQSFSCANKHKSLGRRAWTFLFPSPHREGHIRSVDAGIKVHQGHPRTPLASHHTNNTLTRPSTFSILQLTLPKAVMSRFVSGGTDAEPTQRDEAWLKAQQELDAAAIAKQEAARAGSGKSLYETLQANKGV